MNSPVDVIQIMTKLLDMGVRQFNVLANEINPSRKYMSNLVNKISDITKNYSNIGWFTYLRPDYMDEKELANLRGAGCVMVRMGVETGSQRLLDRMEKGYDIKTVSLVLKRSADAGILNHVNFLVGYPGEEQEDINATLNFIEANKNYIHSARINPFYLAPGTRLSRNPEKYGLKLTNFQGGYWNYEYDGQKSVDASVIQHNIDLIIDALLSHGIGFPGTVSFFLLSKLMSDQGRDETLQRLRISHPFFWERLPSDIIKARLGNFKIASTWDATICKRGDNYNVTI